MGVASDKAEKQSKIVLHTKTRNKVIQTKKKATREIIFQKKPPGNIKIWLLFWYHELMAAFSIIFIF